MLELNDFGNIRRRSVDGQVKRCARIVLLEYRKGQGRV